MNDGKSTTTFSFNVKARVQLVYVNPRKARSRGNIKYKYLYFRNMAREICNFIFRSIQTGLLTDTVDLDLTIRMVKGIYMYRKDHTAKSTVFSPWSRTIIPFPSLCKKIQVYQDENRQTLAWNKGHATPYFPTQPQPKHRHTSGKTRTRWSNQSHRFNPIKTERYNMQNREMTDFNKIDIVKPTPK